MYLLYSTLNFLEWNGISLIFHLQVITSVSAEDFSKWEKEKFDPEEYFIEMLQVIDGVSQIETQTYTKMPVIATDFIDD